MGSNASRSRCRPSSGGRIHRVTFLSLRTPCFGDDYIMSRFGKQLRMRFWVEWQVPMKLASRLPAAPRLLVVLDCEVICLGPPRAHSAELARGALELCSCISPSASIRTVDRLAITG